MTWSYGKDPVGSDIDYIRFNMGDVTADDPILDDEEIQVFFTAGMSRRETLLRCLESVIARYAREVDYKVGPEQVAASKKHDNFVRILKRVQKPEGGPCIPLGKPVFDPGTPIFDIGMMDNRGCPYGSHD